MNKPLSLDPRLQTVARKVRPGGVFADIGTDHGYLAAYLVESGRCPSGYACDIRPLPLKKAVDTLRRRGLLEQVTPLLSDGFKALPPGCATELLVAGMGGDLIAQLVGDCLWLRDPGCQLVLQPMSKPEHLRQKLCAMGFAILEEEGVRSGRFVYPVLTAAYTGVPTLADPWFSLVGKLPENPSSGTTDLLSHLLASREEILLKLEQSDSEAQRREELSSLTQRLRQLLSQRKL